MRHEPDVWYWERVREDELVRAVLRAAVASLSQRLVAAWVGIGRSSLRKFLAMSDPSSATPSRLEAWAREQPEPEIDAQTVALAVLASGMPAPRRAEVRERLAGVLAHAYAEVEAPHPRWLARELAAAGRDEGG